MRLLCFPITHMHTHARTHTQTGQGMGISVAGRIEQGHVQCGESVLVAPAWEAAVVKCEETLHILSIA